MIKLDSELIDLLNNILETSELSKKYDTPLANIILKLVEETGELSQAYLKYSGSINASKSGWDSKKHLIEEAQDVLLVVLDLLNKIIESDEDYQVFVNFLKQKNEKWKSKLK